MKILEFGDLHIGAGVDEDIRASAGQIIEQAEVIKPTLIVIGGDVYDGETEPEHRNLAASIVTRLADIAPVIIVKGNHCQPKDLDLLALLSAKNFIRVYDQPGEMLLGSPDHEIALHFLPWVSKSAWIAAHPELSIEQSDRSVGALVVDFLRARTANYAPGVSKQYLFGHLTMAGSLAQNFQPLVGEGVTIGYQDLIDCGLSGGVMGHIHLRQCFGKLGEPQFWYPGSICALNFGETSDAKGFAVLDTETGLCEMYDLKCPLRLTYDTVWDGSLTLDFGAMDRNLITGAYVRVKLIVEEGFKAEDGKAAIHFLLDSLSPRELKIVTQTRPREQMRAPEIALAQSACDKLQAYWTATKSTPDEPMRTLMLTKTAELEAECFLSR